MLIQEKRRLVFAPQDQVEAISWEPGGIKRRTANREQPRAHILGHAIQHGIVDRLGLVRKEDGGNQAACQPNGQDHDVDVRTARCAILANVAAGKDRAELVIALSIRARTTPPAKPWVGLRATGIQRMAENAVGVRLPDLEDRVFRRAMAFFKDPPADTNMTSTRCVAVAPRQVLAAEPS